MAAAQSRLARLDSQIARHTEAQAALDNDTGTAQALAEAETRRTAASETLAKARATLDAGQTRKAALQSAHNDASTRLASTRADLAGVEREHQARSRDRDARARQAKGDHGMPLALDSIRAAPGYERALAAVLGRDAKSPLGSPRAMEDGRFWSGATPSPAVPNSLAAHVPVCPPELAARLALVHVVEEDDARPLGPGEWLVTRGGHLRRWDGFLARGEGAAEAARLEAENRFAALDAKMPALRAAAAGAEAEAARVQAQLAEAMREHNANERAIAAAADAERAALRAADQAEAQRERLATRRRELAQTADELAEQHRQAGAEVATAFARRATLAAPEAGRAALAAAQARHETARHALQSATAQVAAQDQALAVGRERANSQSADIRNWQSRAGDAARLLADMDRRFAEIEEERAVITARPATLRRDIAEADAIRTRLAAELAKADATLAAATLAGSTADASLAAAQETLASARETRAAAAARAENEDLRRVEMGRVSGERFQCPPPLLPERFAFVAADVGASSAESASMDSLAAERERLGPVNLVAAEELATAEARAAESQTERAELAEAVNRLRGSIGNLNREGRERLRVAFVAVDGHFRRLFAKLFDGGQAHLAFVDSDDPLEAGLEIFAQPPGKRLQSLTLLSGGEQALTAVALIFALFLTNPAPICVLDEVDAPLDDANVERFCDLLDAMVAETQTRYLIVTHNAVTMSRMHRLFGVTMVERGVSRLVSVDLQAAERLLAEAG